MTLGLQVVVLGSGDSDLGLAGSVGRLYLEPVALDGKNGNPISVKVDGNSLRSGRDGVEGELFAVQRYHLIAQENGVVVGACGEGQCAEDYGEY